MKPGIYKDLPNNDYHSSNGISKSGLDLIAKSPAHFLSNKVNGRVISAQLQKTFNLGSAFHCLVLEPEKFKSEFIVSVKFDSRTKAGKEAKADFIEFAKGKTVIDEYEFAVIKEMAESVKHHPIANELLTDGVAESSYYWIDSETNELCKCRPDWLKNNGLVVDLKSTLDASPESFAKSCANYHYDKQAAFYQDGINACGVNVTGFIFIAVEKTPPYAVGVYELDFNSIENGYEEYRANLDAYSHAKNTGVWKAYDTEIKEISLPGWAFRKEDLGLIFDGVSI